MLEVLPIMVALLIFTILPFLYLLVKFLLHLIEEGPAFGKGTRLFSTPQRGLGSFVVIIVIMVIMALLLEVLMVMVWSMVLVVPMAELHQPLCWLTVWSVVAMVTIPWSMMWVVGMHTITIDVHRED